LLFSIGGHPAFNCPLDPMGEAFEDYEIDFHEDSPEKEVYLLDGLFLGQTKGRLVCPNGKLNLSYDLFKNDAIIIDSKKPFKISVKNKKSGAGFSMEYRDFRWLGIWTKQPGAGFLCLEPWNGIADTVDHDQDFEKKLGINTLSPGEKYEVKYLIEFY
jgi:galactose mutarotase-like enzyme